MKKISMFAMAALAAALLLGLCSCGGSAASAAAEKPAVALLIANTANSKKVNTSAPMISDTILNCATNYGHAFLIRIDGKPELIDDVDLDIDDQYKNASKERLTIDARSRANSVLDEIDQVVPKYEEVDFLEGLRLSGAALRSLDDSYTSRTVIMSGSGMQTTGYLPFQNGLLNADPEAIVATLKEEDALPDLTGITVYCLGLGQVTDPQAQPLPRQVNNLKAIWQAIVEASGGAFIANDYVSSASDEETGDGALPSVSVIDIPAETPITFEDTGDDTAFEEPIVLSEAQVEFVGDEAVYLYPEQAEATIQPIAEYLLAHDSVSLLLVGCTAGDETGASSLQLSSDRAEAVKATLVSFGVSADRLITKGMGSDDPWHISGAGYEGATASANRKVVLLDARSELAAQLLNDN